MRKGLELMNRLSRAAIALRKASRWKGSLLPVDAARDDFLYELLCYFRVALAAKEDFKLEVANAIMNQSGRFTARWPQKPGNKCNFSFFLLKGAQAGETVFQLCPGIRIKDRHNKRRAPDINLLHGNTGAEPSSQDLAGIWDAKYLMNSASRLPDTQVSDFAWTFQQLGSPVTPSIWIAATKKPEFRGSGILTNGKFSTEMENALKAEGILETEQFPDSPATRP